MDTITHGLVGVVGSRMGVREHFGTPVGRLFVLSTILPDIDNVARLAGPLSSLAHHRGITHSIFGAAAIALLLAALARWRWSTQAWWKLWVVFYLGLLSHILLDLLTSFGTLIFTPFSSARYSLDALFIIDLSFTGICVATLLLTRRRHGPQRSLRRARLGGLVLAGYVAVALVNHQLAVLRVRDAHPLGKQLEVAAQPFYPTFLNWRGFVKTADGYDVASLFLLDPRPLSFEHVTSEQDTPHARLAGNLSLVKLYYWFARFPVVRVSSGAEGTEVKLYDLRFTGLLRREPPFVMRVHITPSGRASAILFGDHIYPVE
ncbi:MAG: metal-dependent hydrolase [Candidatus Tectomicrobia bacterium]|nr:metal-dependent hydrolase [Candidatus Tectomicrobia bacterium]